MIPSQPILDSKGNIISLPTKAKVGSLMRNNLWVKRKYEITDAFVVGSVAKGTATPDSDIDIAVIIPSVRGKSSLQVTEQYHSRFYENRQMPHFKGRRVDLQFFYESDLPKIADYAKLPLEN